MFRRLVALSLTMVATVTVLFLVAAFVPGCGPASHEVDRSAEYSAESLAQELVFRFRSLVPESRKSTRAVKARSKVKTVAELETGEKLQKKASGGAVTKKRTGPPTIDDVLDDIDEKLSSLKGASRSESRRKMIDAISKDVSITAAERNTLTELLGRLAD
jgi:hypothetical protein